MILRTTIRVAAVTAVVALLTATAALAHAFIDHADPPVGRTVHPAPAAIRLWFTQELEPAFSRVQVFDANDQRVDRNDSHVDPKDRTELAASLKPLPPGSYKVVWRVVSVDTHVTEGHYTFKVAGP